MPGKHRHLDQAAQLVALELMQAVVSRNWLWLERILKREDLDLAQLVVEMARLAAGMGERMFVMPGGFQAELGRARNVLGDAERAG